jgi:hypothetical protein
MASTQPVKHPVDRDAAIDEAIEKIEQSLPALRRVGRVTKKQKRLPTSRLHPAEVRSIKARFEALRDTAVDDDDDGCEFDPSGNGTGF